MFKRQNKTTGQQPEELTADFLVSELLLERRRDRRFSMFKFGLISLGALVYFGYAALMLNPQVFASKAPVASVVKISGVIAPGKEASYESLAPLLKTAFENPESKGVVLNINSPGGTPVQASLIHDLIVELKTKHHKPVIAVGEDMLTSGAYFVAVAADTILVNRSTVAGSIGVISAGFGFSGLMDKLGVERRVVTAGDSKNLLDSFKPADERDVTRQRELLAAIHTHFKEVVMEGRKDRLRLDTPGLFEGTVWTGDQAVQLGLADELGSVQTAMKQLKVDKVVTLSRRRSLMESVLETAGVKVLSNLVDVEAASSKVLSTLVDAENEAPMAIYR